MARGRNQQYKTSQLVTTKAYTPSIENKFVNHTFQQQENPYAKPNPIKYFRCLQNGHKSNERTNMWQANFVEGES